MSLNFQYKKDCEPQRDYEASREYNMIGGKQDLKSGRTRFKFQQCDFC